MTSLLKMILELNARGVSVTFEPMGCIALSQRDEENGITSTIRRNAFLSDAGEALREMAKEWGYDIT